MPDPTEGEAVPVRPFNEVLTELNAGRTHAELSTALHELIQAVNDTGRKGSVTLTIQVTQMKNTGGRFLVSDRVALKKPQPDRVDSVFFADHAGNLSRNDPKQLVLPEPERVDTPQADVETVAGNVTPIERTSRA